MFFGIFLFAGMALGQLARMALDEAIGAHAGIGDRLGGATLGTVRVGLVATSFVLVFDQLVPPRLQPAFLTGSQLRPLFSAAGQNGFSSLPPDVAATIDRLKKRIRSSRARHACHAFWQRAALIMGARLGYSSRVELKNHLT